jgi:AraC-like DNA-binding protein
MLRITKLFQSSLLTIERSDHPLETPHIDGRERKSLLYEVTFVESGQFSVRSKAEDHTFEHGDILLSYPGGMESIFHPDSGARDVCLSVKLETESFESSLGVLRKRAGVLKRNASAGTAFQLQRIRHALQTQDPLVIEEIAVTTAHAFVPSQGHSGPWDSVDRSFAWYARRIERVCDYLNEEYVNFHSVTDLARVAGISPYHFCRVFHYLVGLPLHQYVMKRRLAASAKAMRDGMLISDAAYSTGFASLSYFSRAFRRHFGSSPRAFARRGLAPCEADGSF